MQSVELTKHAPGSALESWVFSDMPKPVRKRLVWVTKEEVDSPTHEDVMHEVEIMWGTQQQPGGRQCVVQQGDKAQNGGRWSVF